MAFFKLYRRRTNYDRMIIPYIYYMMDSDKREALEKQRKESLENAERALEHIYQIMSMYTRRI